MGMVFESVTSILQRGFAYEFTCFGQAQAFLQDLSIFS